MSTVPVNFRKSRRSIANGSCVEVGTATAVVVRDTTDRQGPALRFSPAAWTAFTAVLKGSPGR